MTYSRLYGLAAIVLCVAACDSREEPPAPVASGAAVSHEDIVAAAPDDWLTHGRDYAEQRYSPLDAINADNVAELGLAWYFDVPTERGMEATPIVVDGRMYVTGSWSIVYALDAATGDELWRHDPEVPKSWAQYACCDAVNRGVAAWGDSIFVGTLDGYLVSLDMATGTVNWKVDTIDRKPPYTITGAPRVIDGKVIIGNGGADLGVRGYVSAYDADSGELAWRFHTVPGNPDDGFENDALALAADTWTGTWWQHGGGLRSGTRPALHRRRQRFPLESATAQSRRRGQPVPVLDRGTQACDGRVRLALPDDARGYLGLHGNAAHRACRSRDRR